ncbi:sensor histidine kinase [Flavobacterium ginsenosidimutans]|uniref:Sensor histidine kinase n=1 Tax=Flavobacterium ginsenosidimutans TaxID=687844 RepID=A0ABZ2QBR7_9FLAO|nr:sensor histidine kinase [Flavobacterium ginsenosidimutans]KAF2329786.1 sensor histidine kinase [Flavobacterium ginsenosidimutans]
MDSYTIFIKDIAKSHNQTLQVCDLLVKRYEENPNTILIIDFSNCEFIYPDYAILLLCTIKYIEHLGYTVSGNIKLDSNKSIVTYLAKMNFFENLNVKLPISLPKFNHNNAVQIQKYTSENQIEVLNRILKVLREKSAMHDNVYASLDYCFNEILDNVLNHTEEKVGWVVAQYFQNLNSIRLIVCDFGLGIHKSLNQKHNFTEEEAITKCIESGVTNGKGQGHGLFATASFIRLNKGWLSLISGKKKLNVSEKKTVVKDIPNWQGTCVYIRINTNVEVDYKEFTSQFYDYKKQVFENLFEN